MYVPMVARAGIVAGLLQPILPNLFANDTVSVQANNAYSVTKISHTHTAFDEAPAFTDSVSFYHAQASQSFDHMHAHPEVLLPHTESSSSTWTSSEWQTLPTPTTWDSSTSFWSASQSDFESWTSSVPVSATPTRASQALTVTETAEVQDAAQTSRSSNAFATSGNPFEDPIFAGTMGLVLFGLRILGLF